MFAAPVPCALALRSGQALNVTMHDTWYREFQVSNTYDGTAAQ